MKDESRYIRKAILMCCVLLVISLIMGYSIYSAFSSRIYANINESMSNNLKFAESTYNIFMNQMKMGMLQASVETGIKELILKKDRAALEALLQEWGKYRYYVNEWYVVDRDGSIISSAGNRKDKLLIAGEKTRIQSIIERAFLSNEAIMGTELIDAVDKRDNHTLMQYVIVPVLDNENNTIGGIITAINLSEDNNIIGKIMDDTGMHSIISAKDRIVASSLESGMYRFGIGDILPENISRNTLIKGVPFIGRIGITNSPSSEEEYFVAFRAIEDIEGSIIGVQGVIYYDSLAKTTLEQTKYLITTLVLLLAAIFSIIVWNYLKSQNNLLKEKLLSNKLDTLRKFSDLVRQASSEDEVYDILFDMLKTDSNITQIVVARKEYNGKQLTVYKVMDKEKLNSMRGMSVNEENCRAAKSGKDFVCNDEKSDLSCDDFYSNSESYICLPIILGGLVSGVIQLQSDKKDYFTEEKISDIKIYIDTITPVISNLRLLDSLNNLASMDTLTKVYNRRYLEKYLDEQINASKESNFHFSIIMLDIDFFKKFNDTYGHDAGDYVLMHFADTLRFNVREDDIVTRYGGEEFVVVLPRTGLDRAYIVAEKLRKKVEEMSLAAINSEAPPRITCSLGISCYPLHGDNIDKLIQSADKALYKAKNSGRNRTCIFGEDNDRENARDRFDDI